jgi:hypothetical protein
MRSILLINNRLLSASENKPAFHPNFICG